MYKIKDYEVWLTRGDTFDPVVGMKTMDGTIYTPVEGDVIRFGLKQNIMETECLIEKIVPNDTLVLQLDPEDTKPFQFGDYVYDIELKYASGRVDTFINNQPFHLVAEVVD